MFPAVAIRLLQAMIRRVRYVLAAVLLASGIGACLTSAATARTGMANAMGLIAFSGTRGIYVMNSDGTALHLATGIVCRLYDGATGALLFDPSA